MIKKYKLKNGETRYQFQIYIGIDELTGRQLQTTRRGFKTKKEAMLEKARLELQIANGEYKKKTVDTFKEVYKLWLETYKNTVEESTLVKTKELFDHHILPSLGDYRIAKITIDICQKSVNEWAEYYKSYSKLKAYSARVFRFAMSREFIDKNPMDLVELPRKRKTATLEGIENKNFYSRAELIEFLNCTKKENDMKIYTFFHLLAFTGMRKGEALALTWNDIDFDKQNIIIDKAIARGNEGKLYVKPPKTGDARNVSIDEGIIKVLKNWKKLQKKIYLNLGFNTGKSSQLVFSNLKNKFIQPSQTNVWIKKIQNKYDLKKITTHGLRHTHCTLLFEANVSLQEVQNRLGHSDSQTTYNIYTHITENAQHNAINSFSNFMFSD